MLFEHERGPRLSGSKNGDVQVVFGCALQAVVSSPKVVAAASDGGSQVQGIGGFQPMGGAQIGRQFKNAPVDFDFDRIGESKKIIKAGKQCRVLAAQWPDTAFEAHQFRERNLGSCAFRGEHPRAEILITGWVAFDVMNFNAGIEIHPRSRGY
nr:hypothetical protein [Thiorhodovibrio frisius]